jgi:outer membrane protein OmpA-like peptidoglycan-associated protein
MKSYPKIVAVSLLLCSVAITANSATNDCQQAEEFYNMALKAGSQQDFARASQWLDKSTRLCSDYRYWHLLGRAEQNLGQLEKALLAYEKSEQLAESDTQRANAIARYGEVLSLNGQRQEALKLIHAAREMLDTPPEWMTDLARELDLSVAAKPVTKEQIKRGFHPMKFKSLQVTTKPSVNIRINFLYDSTELDELSQENLKQLAAALADEEYRGKLFLLVGHSDVRGEEYYNKDLSLKRAETIRKNLIAINSSLSGRLKVDGWGESHPLYKGNSEVDHQLNRRLQVIVE